MTIAPMTAMQEMKTKADSVLVELFQSLFEEIDTEKIRREVAKLRATQPSFEPVEHARLLARRTAFRCAATGAITGIPSGIAAVAALGADLAYLIYQQFRLIIGIAAVYGHNPSSRERFQEALACLAYGSGVGLGKSGLAVVLETASIEGAMIAERIGTRFLRDRLGKMVPVIGAVSAGALNYFAVQAVGKATIRYYESKIDPTLADEIWAEGDREHA